MSAPPEDSSPAGRPRGLRREDAVKALVPGLPQGQGKLPGAPTQTRCSPAPAPPSRPQQPVQALPTPLPTEGSAAKPPEPVQGLRGWCRRGLGGEPELLLAGPARAAGTPAWVLPDAGGRWQEGVAVSPPQRRERLPQCRPDVWEPEGGQAGSAGGERPLRAE